jgi:hypothetical protein
MEETITLVRWTRSSSQQFSKEARILLACTIPLAQQVEDQLLHFSQMIEATEQMMTCLHHISTTLQLSLDSMCTLQTQFQHQQHMTQGHTDLLLQLEHTARYHLHLLTDLTQTTRSHATLAQTLITQCSTLAQGLHQSSIAVLQTAEQLTTVAWVASPNTAYITQFLSAAKASGTLPDLVSYHMYPCTDQSISTCPAHISDYGRAAQKVNAAVQSVLGHS